MIDKSSLLNTSQEALDFRYGVHCAFISEIERGLKSPRLHTVFSLAEALGMKPPDLIRMAEEEAKERLTK